MRLGNRIKLYIGTLDFYKRVGIIAVPIALQSLISIGVNMMDTVMLGVLGEVALSASSLANQFINIYHICCMGIGMGASVMVARFWGMNDHHSLKQSITIMLRLCIIFGLLFMMITILAPEMLMRIYTPDADIIAQGVQYFKWSVPSYLLLGLSLTCTIVLRSVGKAKIPLLCSSVSFIANLFFNWVFIFGHFGAPRMEVAGAALGTLLARSIEFSAIAVYFFLRDKSIGYRINDLFMDCHGLVSEYLKICIPVLISDSLLALGNSAIAMIMGRIGAAFVSANSITAVTQQMTTVLTQGISQAGCIITGHTIGEGKKEQAQREGYTFLFFGAFLGVTACLIIMSISGTVIGMYNIQEETRLIAEQLMESVAIILIFTSANSILTKGVLRGGGDTKFLMLADIMFLWFASVPLGIMAGLVWELPAFWIYFFMKIDQIIKCVWCVYRLHSGKWIKAINKAEEK